MNVLLAFLIGVIIGGIAMYFKIKSELRRHDIDMSVDLK